MPPGTRSDFTIYQEQFWTGVTETLQQETNIFNGASGGAITLVPRRLKGDYENAAFIKDIASLIVRRDPTSTSAATKQKMEDAEHVGVKLNRRIGPVSQTKDSFRKAGADPRVFSLIFGRQVGKALAVDYVNAAVRALVAAITNQAALVEDQSGAGTMTTPYLVKGMARFGDAGGRIALWAMHSKAFYDLLEDQVTEKIFTTDGASIYQGNPATFGRPVLVTDDASFINTTPTPDEYTTLGLVPGACEIAESEERDIESDVNLGNDNIELLVQGEYAMNVKLRGYSWDKTNGGVNPTDAALALGTNWDKVVGDDRSTAGIAIVTQ